MCTFLLYVNRCEEICIIGIHTYVHTTIFITTYTNRGTEDRSIHSYIGTHILIFPSHSLRALSLNLLYHSVRTYFTLSV